MGELPCPVRNFLLTRTSFLDLCGGDHFPGFAPIKSHMHRSDMALQGPGRLCLVLWQPHTSADTNPSSGRTVCDLWDCVTALANLVFCSRGPNLTLHLIFLKCCRAETPGLFPALLFVQIFSPLARTRRRGYRSITPASSWPRGSGGFQPNLPSQVFFKMRPIWAPSIFPRRVYFPEKTELLMLREIISLGPVLWSFGYTPYLVCCREGVVSVFCIWHVDGNS